MAPKKTLKIHISNQSAAKLAGLLSNAVLLEVFFVEGQPQRYGRFQPLGTGQIHDAPQLLEHLQDQGMMVTLLGTGLFWPGLGQASVRPFIQHSDDILTVIATDLATLIQHGFLGHSIRLFVPATDCIEILSPGIFPHNHVSSIFRLSRRFGKATTPQEIPYGNI